MMARAGIMPALFLVLAGFGCSPIVEFQAPPLTYGPTVKLDINVLLQLSEELRTTRWERAHPPRGDRPARAAARSEFRGAGSCLVLGRGCHA